MRRTFYLALLALPLLGQPIVSRDLTLLVGRGELLQFRREIQRVAVAEPRIADAVVVLGSLNVIAGELDR